MAWARWCASGLALSLALLLPPPLWADFELNVGDPDTGNVYSNVGAAILRFPQPPPYDNLVVYPFICSGTLVGDPARVFVTAAHCFDTLAPLFRDPNTRPQNLWVTFGPKHDLFVLAAEDAANNTPRAQVIDVMINPRWFTGTGLADDGDVAALLLNIDPGSPQPPVGILPAAAELPASHLLDNLVATGGLDAQRFAVAGYGATDVSFANDFDPGRFFTGAPKFSNPSGYRHVASGEFLALPAGRAYITLSMNPSTGDGGSCYGDSGGPNFLGDTRVIAAITSTGDTMCRATNVAYRLDSDSAQSFFRLLEEKWGVRLLEDE